MKSKCLNREEFVVVGWTEPIPYRRDAVGYDTENGRLLYAGRAGTGITGVAAAESPLRSLQRNSGSRRLLQASSLCPGRPSREATAGVYAGRAWRGFAFR